MSHDARVTPAGAVAIIGMAGIFPGAPDVATYWANIVGKVDSTGEPPPDWQAEAYYDPDATTNDRVYTTRGGYLGDLARFDPLRYGVMPRSIDGGEPDHFLALRVAHEALEDAGYLNRPFARERTGVIIGRGTYINRGYTTLVQHAMIVDQTIGILRQLHPEHSEEDLARIRADLKASLPPFTSETAPGLVPNIVSGRIANRLDLMGPNYTVDAACASSLIALELAIQELRSGRCDLVLAGGVHASTPHPILLIFSQLNALSRRGRLRAFDKDADGTLLGEAVGFVVLKRQADAERDGDRVYALVRGVGVASDGRALGLLAPRVEGEELALRRAYEVAGIAPRSVDLIEAHGTGTAVGDATEVEALRRVFEHADGEAPWCALGTVKSMICHTIPAAGIAGVIKTALALHHKVLPPTLCDAVNPALGLERSPFYVNTETRPWIHGGPEPRRAGVNAFGFGGINAHAILEEHGPADPGQDGPGVPWDAELVVLEAGSRPELIREVERLRSLLAARSDAPLLDIAWTCNARLADGPLRLALVASSAEDLAGKLAHAADRLADSGCSRIRDRRGVYFTERPLRREGTVAFLFPGEGAQYPNMLRDLCLRFASVRGWFDLMDRVFSARSRERRPAQVIFPPPGAAPDEKLLWQMDIGAESVFTANQALLELMRALGVEAQAAVGHSTGEYSALLAAGGIELREREELVKHTLDINGIYESLAAAGEIPRGLLLAIGGVDLSRVTKLVEGAPEPMYVAMDNCPSQIVVCGTERGVAWLREALHGGGGICQVLPFERAYHTPLFASVGEAFRPFYDRLPFATPRLTLYSAVAAGRYPPEPEAVRELALSQWSRPVRFRETIEAMYADGVRLFVEVGPRGNLTAFVSDILRGRDHLATAIDGARGGGLASLLHTLGMLSVHGVPLRLDAVFERRGARRLDASTGSRPPARKNAAQPYHLAMGLQPMSLPASAGALRGAERPPIHRSPPPASAADAAPLPPPASAPTAVVRQERPEAPVNLVSAVASEPVAHPASPDGRGRVLSEYFRTMETFLQTQESVMRGFLGGGAAAPRIAVPRPAVGAVEDHPATVSPATVPEVPVPPPTVSSAPPVPLRPAPVPAGPAPVRAVLLALVSEKTGYPPEALQPTLNLEADLGIDSIKRVEILGAFQRETGLIRAEDMEKAAALKTLQQILDFVTAAGAASAGVPLGPSEATRGVTGSAVSDGPFVGEVLRLVPGREVTVRRVLDIDEDLFMADHTLGGQVSIFDEALLALPVVPLTISMEILAEVAALLVPGRLVIGMKDIRAYRWIAMERSTIALQVTASVRDDPGSTEVRAELREVVEPAGAAEGPAAPVIVEAVVVFGDAYPDAPVAGEFPIQEAHRSRWEPDRLYAEGMFHGPSFRGVAGVDRVGADGIEARLKGLAPDRLFRSEAAPRFLTDPVLLDAAGQLVGYWTAEQLPTGFNVFPFRVAALQIFGPAIAPGEVVGGRARIALVGDSRVQCEIDVVRQGRVAARLVGWEDRRFDLPPRLYALRISPRDGFLGTPWQPPLDGLADSDALVCIRLERDYDEVLEGHGLIWQRVLAHLILSRAERETWQGLTGRDRRRTEWLLGRAALKDAVRLLVRRRYGLELCPADVEIGRDEHGRPLVGGRWTDRVERVPVVSLSHTHQTVVAVAGEGGTVGGVGVDIETLGRVGEDLDRVAFGPGEREILASLDGAPGEDWRLRFWCAKEAVAKSLGRGLTAGPREVVVERVDASTGRLGMTLQGSFAREFPRWNGEGLTAQTARDGDLVVGMVCLGRKENSDGESRASDAT